MNRRTALRPFVAPLISMVVAGCSVFGIRSGYEQPDYQVVQELGEAIEVRNYPPRTAIETVVGGGDAEAARGQAFTRLFDYIQGANQSATEIAMTAPVESAEASSTVAMTVPVETRSDDETVRMRFFLPAGLSAASAPHPSDPEVRLVEVPTETFAVVRFSGRWHEENLQAATERLLTAVQRSGWSATGEPRRLFYDPPFSIPWLRRNEIAVPIAKPADP